MSKMFYKSLLLLILILTFSIFFTILASSKTEVPEKDTYSGLETSYIVKPGDCLWKISKRFGISIEELTTINNIANPSIIYPGQVLVFSKNGETGSKNFEPGIILTFDDHSIDNWYSARDLFKKYHAKVTFFVDHFDKLDANSISKLKDLKQDGHEIGCHGFRHLNAVQYIAKHSVEEYIQKEINPAIKNMKDKGFEPTSFAYPYGARSETLDSVLLEYFDVIRGTAYVNKDQNIKSLNKVYLDNKNESIVYAVSIDNITGKEVTTILDGLKRAKKNSEIILFYAHDISIDAHEAYNTDFDTLEAVLSYAFNHGLRFYTCSEVNGSSLR